MEKRNGDLVLNDLKSPPLKIVNQLFARIRRDSPNCLGVVFPLEFLSQNTMSHAEHEDDS